MVYAQLVFSVTLVAVYYIYFTYLVWYKLDKHLLSIRDFFPQRIPNNAFTNSHILNIVNTFFIQGISKQFLSEGTYMHTYVYYRMHCVYYVQVLTLYAPLMFLCVTI